MEPLLGSVLSLEATRKVSQQAARNEKSQFAISFQVSACITFVNDPLANNASYMTKPRLKSDE